MKNFIFKSANGLIKNDSIHIEQLYRKLDLILEQNRHLRQDAQDILRMCNKLLIDKHLQMQVDEYFTEKPAEADLD